MQIEVLNKHLFLSAKPIIYLINLSERDYIRKKNKWSAITLTHSLVPSWSRDYLTHTLLTTFTLQTLLKF